MLRGKLVVLRPFKREDLEDFHRWCSDYEALVPFQPWREERISLVKLEKEFQEDGFICTTRPIVRVEAWTWAENAASARALEKCGFRREGVSRRCVFFNGAYRDMAIYSILREEWEGR